MANVSNDDAKQRLALSEAILSRAEDIERRWLERVTSDIADKPVDPTALRDGIHDYIRYLAEELKTGHRHVESEGTPPWARTAQEHGIARVRIGFDIDQLVHEFTVLRQVLFAVIREQGVVDEAGYFNRIADLIGVAIAEAVKSYVDFRDEASRRVEAEHVAFITHELRNPLTTAMVAASQVKSLTTLSPPAERAFQMIERNQERLRRLIDNVLHAERMQATPLGPTPVSVSLGEIMERALQGADQEAQHKGLTLDVRYERGMRLRVDPELTVSIVQNLVDNAVKYTDEGAIRVTVEEHPDVLTLHVRDNCSGVSNEDLAKLFQPFRRGPHRDTQTGWGLGLSIARRAAEAQGGEIDAESLGERGCHFWLTLPRWVELRSESSRSPSHQT